MARLVSLLILTVLIVFLGITFYQVIAPFLLPLFLAGVVTVLCQPLFRHFQRRTGQRTRLAAALTTASILAIVLLPLLVGILVGSLQLYTLTRSTLDGHRLNPTVAKVRQQISRPLDREALFERTQPILEVLSGETNPQEQEAFLNRQLDQFEANLRGQLKALSERSLGVAAGRTLGTTFDFLGASISVLIALMIFTVALYYFLADGPALLAASEEMIPVHAEYQRQLLQEFAKVVRAVVLATFLAAIAQGLVTSASLYAVGFPHFVILFIVATCVSLIPLAGAWLVWLPCAIWLATLGEWGAAAFVTAVGALIVGPMDNVIRAYILHNDAKLHPLLAFVSVLGGLQMMGLWGVFIGPIVACFLHALVLIFNKELKEFSKMRLGGEEAAAAMVPQEAAVHAAASSEAAPSSPVEKSSATNGDSDGGPAASQSGAKASGRSGRSRRKRRSKGSRP